MAASQFTIDDDPITPLHAVESLSAPASLSAEAAAAVPNRWIINPLCDFLFCYGGLVWLLLACDFVLRQDPNVGFAIQDLRLRFSVLLAFLFTNTHTMATLFRLYGEPELGKQLPFCRKVLPVLCAVAITGALFISWAPGVLVKINLCWNAFHWASQSYGIALIYCFKRQYKLGKTGRAIIWWAVMSAPILYLVRTLCDPHYLDLKSLWVVPDEKPWIVLPLIVQQVTEMGCAVVFVAFIGLVLHKLIKDRMVFPWPAMFVLATSFVTWVTNGNFNMVLWLFAQPLYHGAQYLALCTSIRLKRQCQAEVVSYEQHLPKLLTQKPILSYFAMLIICGGFVTYAIPEVLHRVAATDVMVVSAICTSILSFQHFIIDMRIWRLRDPKLRELLLS